MRKKYVKPEAIFESFELSTNIAAGCGLTQGANHAQGSCTFDYLGEILFTGNMTTCAYAPEDWGGICYQVPTAANKMFSS